MDFNAVTQRMFALYGQERYDEAITLLEEAAAEFPDRDQGITFWRACLLGVSGRAAESLRTLEDGLDRDLWWAPSMLGDTDFDSVRSLPGWSQVLERCRATTEVFKVGWTPHPRAMPAKDPVMGTLVTLHGAGANPDDFGQRWREATPERWTVIVPEGPSPTSSEAREWPRDHPDSESVAQLEGLELTQPVVLAGWSQGCGVACWWAWNGLVETAGLLLVGPGYLDWWTPDLPRKIPTYIFIGEQDFLLPGCLEHQRLLEQVGVPVYLDLRPGLGHQMPDDLDLVISAALDWIADIS